MRTAAARVVFLACLLAQAWPATAQTLGTYRWQLEPYCNVVTLTVTQLGSQFRFEGFDDQCAAATRAAVTGLGVPNADGSLEFGLTIIGATGPQHLDVTFNFTPLGGPWRDGSGATGTFAFLAAGNGSGGVPRPFPVARPAAGSVTSTTIAAGAVDSSKILDGSVAAVDVVTTEIQRRVTGTCPAGQSVQAIGADGSVVCGSGAGGGTITGVTAGTGLTGGGTSGMVTLNATLAVAGSGAAATAARTDHTHQAAGTSNFAVGASALPGVTSGVRNTALGISTLAGTTGGVDNVAVGYAALDASVNGVFNVAVGSNALGNSAVGNQNTAVGYNALLSANSSSSNVAIGAGALQQTTLGGDNVAVGADAMVNNQTGQNNVAIGKQALRNGTAGNYNVAMGFNAMIGGNGSNNVAIGLGALPSATGNSNIAIGDSAGTYFALSNNIAIGHLGDASFTDAGTIRVGTPGTHTRSFVAGITGVAVSNAAQVLIDSGTGQLGTLISSARFKQDVTTLGDVSGRMQALRPVSFVYKPEFGGDGREIQYGLIAEEVATVMPELVSRNSDGEIQTVKYHLLPALLLAEIQRLERERATMAGELSELRELVTRMRSEPRR
ncbi:MAG: tail fiber domain-containing protein [Acidobacteriota bacterium]